MANLSLVEKKLAVSGNSILIDVHDNIVMNPVDDDSGFFIGINSDNHRGSRVVLPVGKLKGLRFLSLYRFKLWWMTQWMGRYGHEIPFETQFLMVEVPQSESIFYAVFLPVLEGDFRSVLQGNAHDELEICVESGDPCVEEFEGNRLIYVAAGLDPYKVIETSIKSLERHLGTFSHRDNKEMPDILNWFGWCTWDAFYTDVTPHGVEAGIKSLENGGAPARFVIIDDGWQSVEMDLQSTEARTGDSANFSSRLIDIKENEKFRESEDAEPGTGFRRLIHKLKGQYNLKYVYIWHAIVGYWGGVAPKAVETAAYNPELVSVIPCEGILSNGAGFVLESIIENRVGVVNPEKVYSFYNDLHSYLASLGIDGVKVDNQSIVETLGAGFGGRVKLARKYHEALESSAFRNFDKNGIIACMSHSMDAFYSSKKTAVIRASDDFFPRDPASHTIQIASLAYNSIFVGEFMQPDWDMFHSLHPMAEYHGAARAIGGCPVYVSDKPGHHDFDILKKLVLPDGSILRAKLPGRATRDCLFSDPTSDGISALKIWNVNECTGVVGVFNCQGASWSRERIQNVIHTENPKPVHASIKATDVEELESIAGDSEWNGDCIMYSHKRGETRYVSKGESISVEVKARDCEVFTVIPVKRLSNGTAFAAIGLIEMFNSGGAIKGVKYGDGKVEVDACGCGVFGVFSSVRPKKVMVELEEEEGFDYEEKSKLLTISLKYEEDLSVRRRIIFEF